MTINFSQEAVLSLSLRYEGNRLFNSDEKAEIIKTIQEAYDNAPVGGETRKMFEKWVVTQRKQIKAKFWKNHFNASTNGDGVILIDPNYVKKGSYIGMNGTAIRSTLKDGILHELVHALEFRPDNWEDDNGLGLDYGGDTVHRTNQLYQELGIPLSRSYTASDYTEKIIKPGYEYTNGAKIDAALALGTPVKGLIPI
jgi:hypothetical protein